MKTHLIIKVYISSILLCLFSTILFAQENRNISHIQLGFGSAINDAEVANLLHRYSASPKAAFTWASGLTGTHRTYEPKQTDEFIEEVRTATITFFKDAMEGNDKRLSEFLNTYTEEDIVTDEALQNLARSLLNIRKQIEGALTAAESNHPIIFAIEVEGDEGSLEQLCVDPIVRTSRNTRDMDSTMGKEDQLKPQAYQMEYRDPIIQTVSPRDLYSLMIDMASNNAGGNEP